MTDPSNTLDRLKSYARGQCDKREAEAIRLYLSQNPHLIIELLSYMRDSAMEELGIDSTSDPFRTAVVGALSQSDCHIANVRLKNGIESLFEENFSFVDVPTVQDARTDSENKQKHQPDMKTVNFTATEFKAVNESASRMMDNINPEKSTLGNMVAQLLIQVPSMSVDEATDTCRKLVGGVTNFNEVLAMLKEKDASEEVMVNDIYGRCVDSIADKAVQEQAAILINFIAFAKYVDASNLGMKIAGENGKSFEALLSESQSVQGEIFPEMLEQLKAQFKESIANSTIVLTQEESLRELISAAGEGPSLTEELAKKHLSDMDFKSYAALAAYIACLKGEVKGCDENVQPEVLGASVAAGVEREKVMEDAKSGRITWEKAVKYLKWIGGALLYGLFAWVAFNLTLLLFTGAALITTMLLGSTYAAAVAGLILGGFIAYKGTSWFVDSVITPIVDGAGEIYDRVINTLRSGAIMDRVKKTYISVVEYIKKIWNNITRSGSSNVSTTVATS